MGLTQITTGGVDDNINIDSNTLKVDGTNNRVGIGTSNPGAALHIESSGADAAKLRVGFDSTRYYDIFRKSSDGLGLLNFYGSQTGFTGYVFGGVDGERMRIDSSGRVQVGTTTNVIWNQTSEDGVVIEQSGATQIVRSGDVPLLVTRNTSTGQIAKFSQAGTERGAIVYDGVFGIASASDLSFDTSGSERMRIDSSGNVGIGTSSPSTKLHLNSTAGIATRIESTGTSGDTILNLKGNSNNWELTAPNSASVYGFYIKDVTNSRIPLFIDGSGNVGIGTAAPNSLLEIRGTSDGQNVLHLSNTAGSSDGDAENQLRVTCNGNTNWGNLDIQAYQTIFSQNGSEKARLDSGGKLLIGKSSARSNFLNSSFTAFLQVEGTGHDDSAISMVRNSNNSGSPYFNIGKSRATSVNGNTVVQSGDGLGVISFQGADGSEMVEAAAILAQVDGTPGSNDMPGRLVFSTTADGASSTTERMRITSGGRIGLGTTSPEVLFHPSNSSNAHLSFEDARHPSYTNQIKTWRCGTNASSAWKFLNCESGCFGGTFDVEFILRGDGNALADGSFTGGGADYAEYFEWSDGNTEAEDRRGISVVLDGDNIREAVAGEEPIGVISGNPSVVGDAAWNHWNGKYVRDDYGSYVLDENGHRQVTAEYNSETEYISREERLEWGCVGLMGKLRIRKGQITGSRWIKMRDVSSSVEEWLVR